MWVSVLGRDIARWVDVGASGLALRGYREAGDYRDQSTNAVVADLCQATRRRASRHRGDSKLAALWEVLVVCTDGLTGGGDGIGVAHADAAMQTYAALLGPASSQLVTCNGRCSRTTNGRGRLAP